MTCLSQPYSIAHIDHNALSAIINLLGSLHDDIISDVNKFLTTLADIPGGLGKILTDKSVSLFKHVMGQNDSIKYRVFEVSYLVSKFMSVFWRFFI